MLLCASGILNYHNNTFLLITHVYET